MGKFQAFYNDAERLSVKEGKTQREISELLGVSEKTISKWSSKGQWLRQRKEYLTTTRIGPAQKLENALAALIENVEQGELIRDPRVADQITKIVAAIKRLKGEGDILGETIEVMDRFTKYLNRVEQDKEFMGRLAEHIHKFFEETRRG